MKAGLILCFWYIPLETPTQQVICMIVILEVFETIPSQLQKAIDEPSIPCHLPLSQLPATPTRQPSTKSNFTWAFIGENRSTCVNLMGIIIGTIYNISKAICSADRSNFCRILLLCIYFSGLQCNKWPCSRLNFSHRSNTFDVT